MGYGVPNKELVEVGAFQEEDESRGSCRVVRGWDLFETYGSGD